MGGGERLRVDVGRGVRGRSGKVCWGVGRGVEGLGKCGEGVGKRVEGVGK